ncbi:MAG: response regulator [Gammaproteobacteria bacterium]|nr:response regulator [Gammaproteobacteria bacterium]MCP5424420.1 response regulator [Gammaproteobacteria bacterium]MCP5458414.1 response regulator [Gammaproteobacteria bacterium]
MSLNKVLIVDDSKSARLVLTRMLKNWDLNVETVSSGEEALDYLRNHRPDAIFMDHTMPGMTGLQTVKALRENADTANIPVAMYTSKEGDSYADEVKEYHVVGILLKPASTSALQEIIDKLKAATDRDAVLPLAADASNETDPKSTGLSEVATENLAKIAAESVVDEAIRMQILPLLEEKLFQLKEDFSASIEKSISETAGKLYDSRFSTLYRHLAQQVVSRTTEIRTRLEELEKPEELHPDAIKSLVKQGATESRKMLVDYMAQMEEKVTERIKRDIAHTAQSTTSLTTGLSILAIILSIAAMGLVLYFHHAG